MMELSISSARILQAKQVWVREHGLELEVQYGRERIAIHGQAPRKHSVIKEPEHRRAIPLGGRREGKALVTIQDLAPVVEIRPPVVYESAAIMTPGSCSGPSVK